MIALIHGQIRWSLSILDIIADLKNAIGLMSRLFANGLRDRGSVPGRVIPKTQKMVLDAALFNTQVRIKGKVEQSWEWSSAFLYISV